MERSALWSEIFNNRFGDKKMYFSLIFLSSYSYWYRLWWVSKPLVKLTDKHLQKFKNLLRGWKSSFQRLKPTIFFLEACNFNDRFAWTGVNQLKLIAWIRSLKHFLMSASTPPFTQFWVTLVIYMYTGVCVCLFYV